MFDTSSAWITADGRTLQNSDSFRRSSLGIGRSARTSRMSGWMPIWRSALDRVLGRLGLQFPRRRDVGHQRQVDEDGVAARQVVGELADRLEERQGLDVADRAADLAEHEVVVLVAVEDELLDRVGDVRDHLHGGAEIVAAPLLGDDVLVDAPGGDVVHPVRRAPGEALVVAEVEVGLGAVVGDEDLAVLIGAHRPRIDVEVGVELPQPHPVAARLEERAERRRSDAFAEG